MAILRRDRSVLPGFGLTLGVTLTYLCLLVLIPLAGLFVKSASLGPGEFLAAVGSPRALAAYRLTFGASFAALTLKQQHEICDDIVYAPEAAPEFRFGARFFDRFRDLAATGYYTSNAGWQDLGYIGNVPLPRFDGPPPSVLRHLGLEND